jgi:hypothetical protein
LIGEHEIAAGFHSFWSELLPLLTPSCVTVFNKSHGAYLEGFRPVDRELGITTRDLDGPDLLAEAAFEVFRLSQEGGQPFRDVVGSRALFSDAWEIAEANMSLHRRIRQDAPPANGDIAHRYILALGRRYEALKELLPFDAAVFSPQIKGCGILGVCAADISSRDILVEVKTVDRNFSSKDIRQIVIYLALDFISGVRQWNSAILFNPRRSRIVRFNPAEFIRYISAGKTAAHVYREIESFLLHRDFSPEHRF